MAKLRVYQLAKELHVQSALILELLDRLGREVKSDLSLLDAETAELVRRRITKAIAAARKRLEEEQHIQPVEQPEAPVAVDAPLEEPEPIVAEEGEPVADDVVPALPVAARPRIVPTAAPLGRERRPAPQPSSATAHPGMPGRPGAPPAAGPRSPRVFPARRLTPHPSVKAAAARAERAAQGLRPEPPPRPQPTGAPVPGRPAAGGPRPGALPPKKRRKKDKDADRDLQVSPLAAKPKPDLPPVPKEITLSEAVTVKELAEKLNRKSKDVIAKLISRGVLANINQPLDPALAIGVAQEFGSEARVISFEEEAQQSGALEVVEAELIGARVEERPEELRVRPPVVTVMGHVDHGKTSLLDAIREADVATGEAGGITQHIGAYQVEERGRKITFLDTPGHEAFTLMRARGSRVTDIVVLVVAADDGVKPQTVEAIDHAKAAGVPLVVAINKIDKPGAQPDRVKRQLTEHDLVVEEYGGDVVSCEISAKQRRGIDELLEMILLVADMKELRANPARAATGVVLETKLDRARGLVATVLVQDGTLHVGDPFIAGAASGKVRAMSDEHGERVEEAAPAMPVEVIGFADEPMAGEAFQVVSDEQRARQIASFRQEKIRAEAQRKSARRTLESLSRDVAQGEVKELPIILKADSQGSVEALQKSLSELPQEKIRINVIRGSIGAISRADVLLASASDAIIVGFNVRPDRATADLAKQEEVELRLYTVIYDLLQDIKQAMVGMLEPTLKESVLGQAEVRQTFNVPKIGTIAGCYVTDGRVARNAEVRLLRDNVVIHTGKVGSLRRFKDDVSEVKQGFECGIGIAGYNDLKEGDVIEFFVMEKVAAQSL
jgi:translation initiation factor IF-2